MADDNNSYFYCTCKLLNNGQQECNCIDYNVPDDIKQILNIKFDSEKKEFTIKFTYDPNNEFLSDAEYYSDDINKNYPYKKHAYFYHIFVCGNNMSTNDLKHLNDNNFHKMKHIPKGDFTFYYKKIDDNNNEITGGSRKKKYKHKSTQNKKRNHRRTKK